MTKEDIAQLLTPIVNAFLTDVGSEPTNLALQVLGGHGYISEWGVEQWVRNSCITPIHEGTNGILAMDLDDSPMVESLSRSIRSGNALAAFPR